VHGVETIYLLSFTVSAVAVYSSVAVQVVMKLFFMSMGLHYVSELRRLTGLLFIPRLYMSMEGHSGIILTWQNWRTRRKICPSATLSTANPTWTDLGLRCERPVTNCLSHGTAIIVYTLQVTIQQFWGMLSIDSVSSWQYRYWHPHPASLIFHKMQVCAKLKVVSS
jgi:hypothetical protein